MADRQDQDLLDHTYLDLAHAREEQSSPTAKLIQLRKIYRQQPKPDVALPEASIVAPGAEPDARAVPAAPGEKPAGGMGHVESQGQNVELPPAGTMPGGRPEPSRGILPSLGEAFRSVPGGVIDAVKGMLRLPQEVSAMLQGFNASMLEALVEAKGEVPADIQQKIDELKRGGAPDADAQVARVLSKVADRLPEIAEPKTVGGSLIRGLSAFMAPFLGARRVTQELPAVRRLLESRVRSRGAPAAPWRPRSRASRPTSRRSIPPGHACRTWSGSSIRP